MNIAFVTDSTSCLPPSWRAPSKPVFVVPLNVTVGDETFLEGESIDAEAVARALSEGQRVTTSRPAPGLFLEAFEQAKAAGADAVVSVHLPGELSATASAARLAAAESDLLVEVVESSSIGMGVGFALQAGIDARDAGASLDDVVRAVRTAADNTSLNIYVDSLEPLRKGGRLGRTGALFGTALAIKPLLTLKDGKLVPTERVRSTSKAIDRLAKLTVEAVRSHMSERVHVAVHSLTRHDLAERVLTKLRSELTEEETPVEIVDASIGAVVIAHVGPGTVATVVTPMPGEGAAPEQG